MSKSSNALATSSHNNKPAVISRKTPTVKQPAKHRDPEIEAWTDRMVHGEVERNGGQRTIAAGNSGSGFSSRVRARRFKPY